MKRKIIDYYLRNKVEITIFIGLGTLFNTLLITFGIWNGIVQRERVMDSQVKMQYQDSIRGVKIDSANDALKAVHNLEDTLNKIK